LQIPSRLNNSTHVFHQYTLKVQNGKRDDLIKYLDQNGIETRVYYPIPVHKQKVFSKIVDSTYNLPITNLLSATCLSLPIHTELENSDQEYIIDNILNFFK
jgi:dTDP-4-amino-4,6-dideoxygalactose transaminase